MVDTGSIFTARKRARARFARGAPKPLHSAIFSHGHIDHVFGVGPFDEEARDQRVAVAPRHRPSPPAAPLRALRTDGRLQPGHQPTPVRGVEPRAGPASIASPTRRTNSTHDFSVGSSAFHSATRKGRDRRRHRHLDSEEQSVLCSGDLFIWNSPNAGNPQKVQRYPLEWAQALRRMVALDAQYLLPGHGLPIFGRDRIHQALSETAEYLESLVDQTLALMNERRASERRARERVGRRAHLADRPVPPAVLRRA